MISFSISLPADFTAEFGPWTKVAGLTAVILGRALVKDLRIAAGSAFPAPQRGVFSSANERRVVGPWK
jgi:hypothetical protein